MSLPNKAAEALSPEDMAMIERTASARLRVRKIAKPTMTEDECASALEEFKSQAIHAHTANLREAKRTAQINAEREAAAHSAIMAEKRQLLAQCHALLKARWRNIGGKVVVRQKGKLCNAHWRIELPGVLIVTDAESGCLLAQSLPARLKELDMNSPMEDLA